MHDIDRFYAQLQMIEHVHLLLEIPPKYSVSQLMGYLKGKSALEIFDKHATLKC